jgi:WD40 repeat protein
MSIYDNKLAMLLNNGNILQTKIKGDLLKTVLEPVGLQFHNGPIVSMDICIRKPLVATAGRDKCIKIWNYEEKTV